MEITKEQIKQAYETPEKLKEFFPEVFQLKLQDGKWYKKTVYPKVLFCFNGKLDTDQYGFSSNGEFSNEIGVWQNSLDKCIYIEATPEEVEQALVREAKKRGFNDISKISIKNVEGVFVEKSYFKYLGGNFEFENNILFLDGVILFKNGNWAEIIEETKPLELTLDKIAEKFGVETVKIIK